MGPWFRAFFIYPRVKPRDLIRGNVIFARKQMHYKQSDVAQALNVTVKAVSDWERGKYARLLNESLDKVDRLIAAPL